MTISSHSSGDLTQREKRGSVAKTNGEAFHLGLLDGAVVQILIEMMLVEAKAPLTHKRRRKALCTSATLPPPPPSTLLHSVRRSAVNQCGLEKYRWAFRRRVAMP